MSPQGKMGGTGERMADLFSMKNRVVLLTGASRGLGRDMALTLGGAGALVLCAGRTVKEIEATARAIERRGGKAAAVPLDITDEAAVREQVATLVRRHRRIDVLVNNAGIIHRQPIVDTPTDKFRSVIETDLVSQFMLAREVGRHMLQRKYGRIVNVSSIMGILGRATVAGYVSAKHGLIGLTKNLAVEFGPHVTCNAIAPGYIRTELNVPLQRDKAFNAMLEQRTAAHRWGKPEDLRGPLLLLASDAGAYMTGHTLVVDGGMTTILG
jgi:NAD(P)-dependent dehydrogenase (short-subunit alcohol dehydrogenase family)